MGRLKMSKCLIEILTILERYKSHTCASSFITILVYVGSYDPIGSWLIVPTRDPRPTDFNEVGSFDPVSEVPTIT
jgi:ABC-type maltose transport system permease subunit